MNNQTPRQLKFLAVCLMSTVLLGCGESDLIGLQAQALDDARVATAQEPPAGPASPDAGDDSGDTGGGDGTDTGSDGTGGTAGGSDSQGSDTDGGTGDGAGDGAGNGAGGSTAGQSGEGIDLSRYDLVFADDFKGTSIDPLKWNTVLSWGTDLVVYDQMQYYVDTQNTPQFGYNPFTLDGERLTITAIETPDNLRTAANEQPWLSGVLTTRNKFDFTYGYVEVRADFQPGLGIWPSFWMLSSEFEGLKPELFVMEYDGSRPDSIFHNYNYQDAEGNLRSPGQWEVDAEGVSEGFHTIGVSWSPEEFLFFIDRQPRYRIVGENVASQDMYLILNLAIGGVWAGAPDVTTVAPVKLVVDYVRAYQLKQ